GFWSDAPPEPLFEPSLISRRRELRELRIAYSKKALRLGKAIGARSVSITSGRTLAGVPPEMAQKLLLDALKRLIDYAEKLNQPLALSFETPLFVEKTSEVLALSKALNSNYFGADLDFGHLSLSGEKPNDALRA